MAKNKNNSTHPLLAWVSLWLGGFFLVIVRNGMAAGTSIDLGKAFVITLFTSIVLIPVALVAFFVIRFIVKLAGNEKFFEGQAGLKNMFVTWLVFYLLFFLLPLFKK